MSFFSSFCFLSKPPHFLYLSFSPSLLSSLLPSGWSVAGLAGRSRLNVVLLAFQSHKPLTSRTQLPLMPCCLSSSVHPSVPLFCLTFLIPSCFSLPVFSGFLLYYFTLAPVILSLPSLCFMSSIILCPSFLTSNSSLLQYRSTSTSLVSLFLFLAVFLFTSLSIPSPISFFGSTSFLLLPDSLQSYSVPSYNAPLVSLFPPCLSPFPVISLPFSAHLSSFAFIFPPNLAIISSTLPSQLFSIFTSVPFIYLHLQSYLFIILIIYCCNHNFLPLYNSFFAVPSITLIFSLALSSSFFFSNSLFPLPCPTLHSSLPLYIRSSPYTIPTIFTSLISLIPYYIPVLSYRNPAPDVFSLF